MRVIVGFIAGAIVGFGIGVASSIVYSGQTGKDLREVYAGVRENVESVDLEQFGQEVQANVAQAQAQVQTNVAQVQSQVEEKVAQVRGKSGGNGTPTDEGPGHLFGWWSGELHRWSRWSNSLGRSGRSFGDRRPQSSRPGQTYLIVWLRLRGHA